MMFVDYQKKTWDEIEKFNTELRKEHYYEITNFWNIADLWREISSRIPCVRKCFAVFNGKFIILEVGDFVEEDEVYKFIIGQTKKEKELADKQWIEEYEKKEREWKAKIPSLIPEYTEKMMKLTDEKYHHLVNDCVTACLNSIYHEYLIEALVEIVDFSNKNKSFEAIEKKLEEQGHSNMSYSIIVSLFGVLSDCGKEFCEWNKNKQEKNK